MDYREGVEYTIEKASKSYNKICYISLNAGHQLVVKMLNRVADSDKFVIIDATKESKGMEVIGNSTYLMNTEDLFNVYLYLRNLIVDHKIDAIYLDSISALIYKHSKLPLKEMLSSLLLEVGALGCHTMNLVFKEHADHEVLEHLTPFISKRDYLGDDHV